MRPVRPRRCIWLAHSARDLNAQILEVHFDEAVIAAANALVGEA